MKAVRIDAYGGVDRMQLHEAAVPSFSANELLVRVVAAGVNPADWKIRAGLWSDGAAHAHALPLTLGLDAAGVVVGVGRDAMRFQLGDEVFLGADPRQCGTYAEFVAIPEAQTARKPRRLPFVHAAALPTPGCAAIDALEALAPIEAGTRLMIHGAGGAVGCIALQLAKAMGAHVVCTAGAGVALARRFGADAVIDTRGAAWEALAVPVDAVLDTVGGEVQQRSWQLVRRGGRLVSTVTPPDPQQALEAGVQARFVASVPRSDTLAALTRGVDEGRLVLPVARQLALTDAPLAHRLGEERGAGGKMVLAVRPH